MEDTDNTFTDPVGTAHPPFRLAEKYFKNRSSFQLPALRDLPAQLCQPVLDLSRPMGDASADPVWRAGWWGAMYTGITGSSPKPFYRSRKGKERERGVRPEVDLAGLREVPLNDGRSGWLVAEGCILLPSYLDHATQESLLLASLSSYTLRPNPLSLDTHYDLPDSLFDLYATEPSHPIPPRHLSLAEEERKAVERRAREGYKPRTLIDTPPAVEVGYDEVKRKNEGWVGDDMSLKAGTKTAAALMRELRWANLGWVYQWTTKSYDFSTDTPIPFPPELQCLCRDAVASIPWNKVLDSSYESRCSTWADDYAPDTGIVNYYQLNDTLMAHVDRSELDPARPLVSISLGHTAIFLLGSDSRTDPPRPILLRSGDVLIMAGRGRQSYHGVPRIMEGTLPEHLYEQEGDSDQMRAAKRWVGAARVNINARQVFPPGFTRPS